MSGRGDNNKHGTSGQGSSNQSNQPFVAKSDNESASNHSRKQKGSPSIQQPKSNDSSDSRNTGRPEEKTRPVRTDERNFDILVDSVPYFVKVSPFTFNDEVRFNICVNGGEQHVFTWDSEVGGLRAIDDEASTLPSTLEEEISRRLQSIQ